MKQIQSNQTGGSKTQLEDELKRKQSELIAKESEVETYKKKLKELRSSSNKNSNDLHTNKESKKKKSYEHMYKHLPIKAFENQYNQIYDNK